MWTPGDHVEKEEDTRRGQVSGRNTLRGSLTVATGPVNHPGGDILMRWRWRWRQGPEREVADLLGVSQKTVLRLKPDSFHDHSKCAVFHLRICR